MAMPGRWSTPPRRVINCASTYALAILESVVHWNRRRLPPSTRHVVIEFPGDVSRETISWDDHTGWNAEGYVVSQAAGNRWYDSGASLILIVPSVLSPYEGNILINQNHPDIGRLTVSQERTTILDGRLTR